MTSLEIEEEPAVRTVQNTPLHTEEALAAQANAAPEPALAPPPPPPRTGDIPPPPRLRPVTPITKKQNAAPRQAPEEDDQGAQNPFETSLRLLDGHSLTEKLLSLKIDCNFTDDHPAILFVALALLIKDNKEQLVASGELMTAAERALSSVSTMADTQAEAVSAVAKHLDEARRAADTASDAHTLMRQELLDRIDGQVSRLKTRVIISAASGIAVGILIGLTTSMIWANAFTRGF